VGQSRRFHKRTGKILKLKARSFGLVCSWFRVVHRHADDQCIDPYSDSHVGRGGQLISRLILPRAAALEAPMQGVRRLIAAGKLEAAAEVCLEMAQATETAPMRSAHDTAASAINLGWVLAAAGRLNKALDVFHEAYQVSEVGAEPGVGL
jgi:hypothetical protein